MAQYWLNLDRTEAEVVSEFSFLGIGSNLSLDIQNELPALLIDSTNSALAAVVWDVVPLATDVQIYALMSGGTFLGSGGRQAGPAARLSWGTVGLNGYGLALDRAAVQRIPRYDDGVRSTMQSLSISTTQPSHWRFETKGDVIRTVHGTPALDDNPAVWDGSVTDATHTGSGKVGFTRVNWRNANRQLWVHALGVGTDGDPAPTGPLGTTEAFALRHNPRTNKVIPVLSSPTVTDIGAACVRPRVTKGY